MSQIQHPIDGTRSLHSFPPNSQNICIFSSVRKVPVCALELLPMQGAVQFFCMFLQSGVYAGVIFED